VKSARSANALRLGFLPIFEKEVAFSYLDRYDRIAIVDADVYARDTAPDVFAGVDCFGAVAERDMPLTENYRSKVRKHSEAQFRSLDDVDWRWNADGAEFFNMGVMVLGPQFREHMTEAPEQFLRRPEFERFVNGEGHWRWSTDQTLLNYWLKRDKVPVTRMDWRWNALYTAVPDVGPAHFVHFFLSDKLGVVPVGKV
jgi:hypothetical protein